MKAMILAAGVGSRLRPITDELPKALVPVAGVPLLERALIRLQEAGATEFVVNAHHHAPKIAAFCAALSRRRGVPIAVSDESDQLLDTGGAVKKAASLLEDTKPFFVHNADIVSRVDLRALLDEHSRSGALATLACRKRESGRQLLFDHHGILRGRRLSDGLHEWGGPPTPNAEPLAFDGISVMSALFPLRLTETGAFSLIKSWLRLAAEGAAVRVFRTDQWDWHDVGSPEKLARAEEWAVANRL